MADRQLRFLVKQGDESLGLRRLEHEDLQKHREAEEEAKKAEIKIKIRALELENQKNTNEENKIIEDLKRKGEEIMQVTKLQKILAEIKPDEKDAREKILRGLVSYPMAGKDTGIQHTITQMHADIAAVERAKHELQTHIAEKEAEQKMKWETITGSEYPVKADGSLDHAKAGNQMREVMTKRQLREKQASLSGSEFERDKPVKPEPKLTPYQIGKMQTDLDESLANYEASKSVIAGQTASGKPDKGKIGAAKSDIVFANRRIEDIGKQLKRADPSLAPEIDAAVKQHQQRIIVDQHDEVAAQLGKFKNGSEEFEAKAKELNEIKKQIPGYVLVDPKSGNPIAPTSKIVPFSELGLDERKKVIDDWKSKGAKDSQPEDWYSEHPIYEKATPTSAKTVPPPASATSQQSKSSSSASTVESTTLPPIQYGTGGPKAWQDATPEKATHVSINYVAPDGGKKSTVLPMDTFNQITSDDISTHLPGSANTTTRTFNPAPQGWQATDYSHVSVPGADNAPVLIPAPAYKVARESKTASAADE